MIRSRRCALACAIGVVARPLAAHPMPNTEIAISVGDGGAGFDIAVPAPELRLAMPQSWPKDVDLLAEPQRTAVAQYFDAHFSVQSTGGGAAAHDLPKITSSQSADPEVGPYEELRVHFFVPAGSGFEPRAFTLHYDAVIEQVPNHFALVNVTQDFHGGELAGKRASAVGFIRYDFSREVTPALPVVLEPGSVWRGLLAAIALGFDHVISGFDHLLFLITLLVVAPLRATDGTWSLFQGWRYTTRRFLAITLAFTTGHSLSLLLGAYDLVYVQRRTVEVLIAASILLAAINAIRPLFAGREWLIAGGFGIVHGLAFSESLRALSLAPWTKAIAVGGFNIGVEGAQLIALVCTLPLLFASRWRWFHGLRVVGTIGAALLACLWILQGATL